jgi:predicted secreted protein
VLLVKKPLHTFLEALAMKLTFAIVVFICIWWMTLFAVLPFGVRTQDEDGKVVPGTPGSAPARMKMLRVVMINTFVASICFAVFYVGYTQGWLSARETDAPKVDQGPKTSPPSSPGQPPVSTGQPY